VYVCCCRGSSEALAAAGQKLTFSAGDNTVRMIKDCVWGGTYREEVIRLFVHVKLKPVITLLLCYALAIMNDLSNN